MQDWSPITRFLVPFVIALLAIALTVWLLQRRLIYLPAGPPAPVSEVLPAASAVTLTTADGLELDAWYLPSGPTTVIVFPGNAGNRAARAPLARGLAERGMSVLLVEYRGYGDNPGSPSEAGLLSDARAAAAWVDEHGGADGVVYLGESLGGGVAVGLATERRPDALILRSPFPSLAVVARQHYGPVPDAVLRDRYPVAAQIATIDAPVLVVMGEDDGIVPASLSREVYEAASEPKRIVTIAGAGHNDRALLDGDTFLDTIETFLREHALLHG